MGTARSDAPVEQILNLANASRTSSGNSGDMSVDDCTELAIDVNITAITGTTPTLTMSLQRKALDGNYYTIWTGAALSAVGTQSITVGRGCEVSIAFGGTIRLVWTIGGTTPNVHFSASIQGK